MFKRLPNHKIELSISFPSRSNPRVIREGTMGIKEIKLSDNYQVITVVVEGQPDWIIANHQYTIEQIPDQKETEDGTRP